MLVEKNISTILNRLAKGDSIEVPQGEGHFISITFIKEESKILLSTSIYEGSNYIPPSVRGCLSARSPISSSISTFFKVDENNYQISLNYIGLAPLTTPLHFKNLLEEFESTAEKWRSVLDDHDKKDLIFVRTKY